MASPETLTAYERQRLENIQWNKEMMASLMLQRKVSDLSLSLKRPRPVKSPKPDPDSNKAPSSPIVIRRSLRTRQSPASYPPQTPPFPIPARKRHSLLIHKAFADGPDSSDRSLTDAILTAADTKLKVKLEMKEGGSLTDAILTSSDSKLKVKLEMKEGVGFEFDPLSNLHLRQKNVRKVLSERITTVRFFPFADRTVIAAGNKLGHVGFWNVDSEEDEKVHVYIPHTAPVTAISIHPFSATKMYSSSYDGLVRLMDFWQGTSNTVYSSDYLVFSLCQWPQDINCLCVGEGVGVMKLWDERVGDASNSWVLHEDRINTIDFHPLNVNLLATSSTDGTACIWDLRKMKKDRPENIKEVRHRRATHSAFFSPSGNCLATTSLDDTVGILAGKNFEELSMVKHNNQTGRWLSSFRAIWGWDDSYLYIGNMKTAIDVISVADKSMMSLESPDMSAIPCRFAAHPSKEGSLACATAGGKIFLWKRS